MSYVNKFSGFKVKASLVLLLLLTCLALTQRTVNAAPLPSGNLPQAADFSQGNGVHMLVASRGNGYQLEAQNSTIRIYTKDPGTVRLRVHHGAHCVPGDSGSLTDIDRGPNNSVGETIFTAYRLIPNSDYTNTPFANPTPFAAGASSRNMNCSGSHLLQFTPGTASTVPPYDGYYAFEFEAVWANSGQAGWNMFKLELETPGFLSYYAGSGDRFALKDSSAGLPPGGETGNFRLGFAPGCSVPAGATRSVSLRWFDADAGEPNQPGANPIPTVLREFDENNNYQAGNDQSVPIGTGDDTSGSRSIVVKGRHKYEWVWPSIHSANGIQFQLPYDSFNTRLNFDTCLGNPPPPAKNAACAATPTYAPSQNVPVNQSVNITVRVRNTGEVPWNSNYKLQQRTVPPATPGSQTKPVTTPPNVGPGEVETFVFSVVRNNPVSITFDYKMLDENNNLIGNDPLSSCRATVTWGNPPPGGSIRADCSKLEYTGSHFTPNGAGNYANGVPNTKSRFVGSDQATEYGTGPYVKTAVQHFVDTSGMTPEQAAAAHLTDNDPGYTLWVKVPKTAGSIISLLPRQADGTIPNLFGPGPGGERPQYRYTFVLSLYETNLENETRFHEIARTTLEPCWQPISCEGLSVTDYEPGQTLDSSYALRFSLIDTDDPVITDMTVDRDLINVNGSPFASRHGTYAVSVTFNPGISGSHISPNPVGIINNNGDSIIQAILRMRVDYTGRVEVRLMYGNNQINTALQTCSQLVTPYTRPYLKIMQGDVSTGGAFRKGDACPDPFGSDFVSPLSGDENSGGIRTFANPNAFRGSSVDFAAFALGVIEGSVGGPNGFYSNDRNDSGYKSLSFANTIAQPLGGLLGGSNPNAAAHCAPDFFTTTRKSANPAFLPGGNITIPASTGQSFYNGPVTLSGNVTPSTRATIYVNGDVYIPSNISYPANWIINATTNSTPYFALIVEGNINVAPGVSIIEGLYVAQPSSSGAGGTFSTCSPGGTPASTSQIPGCRSPFTLNGALLAQKVLPLRSNGTLWNVSGTAETFNFTPSMVIGIPEFMKLPDSLEGLFRLPPVF